jgi:hypothetical protein
MSSWEAVQHVLLAHLCESNSPDAPYLEPLLRLTCKHTAQEQQPSPTLPHTLLTLLHTMHRHQEVEFYRRIECHDRCITTTFKSYLAMSDDPAHSIYIMWDDLVDEKRFHGLGDLVAFLVHIQDQIQLEIFCNNTV